MGGIKYFSLIDIDAFGKTRFTSVQTLNHNNKKVKKGIFVIDQFYLNMHWNMMNYLHHEQEELELKEKYENFARLVGEKLEALRHEEMTNLKAKKKMQKLE